MTKASHAAALAALCATATPGVALELADCERRTVWSGGEAQHRDLGSGRVAWHDWWSHEGVYTDLVVADCRTGARLTARVREERMSDRPPFDRRARAAGILAAEADAHPALFRLDRLAAALAPAARDLDIAQMSAEPCACAALYPGDRGGRSAFGGLE
jgi:hypothetical protein